VPSGRKRQWCCSPVIFEGLAGNRVGSVQLVLVELLHREEFNRCDAELLEIGYFVDNTAKRARMRDSGRWMDGQATTWVS